MGSHEVGYKFTASGPFLVGMYLFSLICTAIHHRTPQHTTKHANHPYSLERVSMPQTRGKGIPRGTCFPPNLSLLHGPKLTQTLEKLLISLSS
jgi:hypothetical protein